MSDTQTATALSATARRRKPVVRTRRTTIDARTRAGKRLRDLTAEFWARLGDRPRDVLTNSLVRRAAELTVLAETMREKALQGRDITDCDIVRVERASQMAIRSLRLPDVEPEPGNGGLAAYLAADAVDDGDDEVSP